MATKKKTERKRAKAKKRESVIAEDIESYRVRFGD